MAMDFAQQQRDPTRHLIGIGAVVILHVLVVWALVSGLARKVVEVVKGPIEVKVIEEIIKKPPPPPEVVPPAAQGPGAAAAVHSATGNQHRAAADRRPDHHGRDEGRATRAAGAGDPEGAGVDSGHRRARRAQRADRVRELPRSDVLDRLSARGAEGRDRGRRRDRVHGHGERAGQGHGDQVVVESHLQPRVHGCRCRS